MTSKSENDIWESWKESTKVDPSDIFKRLSNIRIDFGIECLSNNNKGKVDDQDKPTEAEVSEGIKVSLESERQDDDSPKDNPERIRRINCQ